MSTSRIYITIKVTDLDDGTCSVLGANDEIVSSIRSHIGNMFSDYVTVELTNVRVSEGEES